MDRATNLAKAFIAILLLATIIYPFWVNAGVLSVIDWVKHGVSSVSGVDESNNADGGTKDNVKSVSSIESRVLSANSVAEKEEILAYPEPNINTISLLQSVNNPESAKDNTAINMSLVDGVAFTNENSSLDGSFEGDDNNDQISLYTVREGDTIPQIAKMFGVSSNTIYWANDLKVGSSVKPDQVIVILPITGIKYVVKKGDTVDSLAKKFKSDAPEIISFNNIDVSVGLSVGQEIIIPNADLDSPAKKPTCSGSKCPKDKNSGKTSGNTTSGSSLRRPIDGGKKTQGLHGYNSVDLASYHGAPIYAAASGVVILSKGSGWNGGYGNYIVIKHPNGTQTLYAHLSANLVRVGESVTRGQQIGKMGNTGRTSGPTGVHLHFEVRGGKNPF